MKTLLVAVALMAASSAVAQEPPPRPDIQVGTLVPASPPKPDIQVGVLMPALTTVDSGPAPIASDGLAELNGRQGSSNKVMSLQDLTAVNQGNTVRADTLISGAVSIDRSAFQGFAGVGNFVVNTGNNNNLQGALTINILSPTP